MLKLYNTLTRKKEEFKPIKNKQVGIYTCGPTVYNHAHIGNLRAYVTADLLQKYLKYSGFETKWVMNITDVDDKTIRDSKKEGVNLKDFTQKYEKLFFEDIEKLNISEKYFFANPKATETISEMQDIIKKLLKNGLAYVCDGSVYFSIKKYIESGNMYGQLLNLDLAGFKDGARVDVDEYEKEDVKDFVLWKGKKETDEPSWDFVIDDKNYVGRPGWHIECSAMSEKYLGTPFDIHTGGVDLIFPHHEDEIAQTLGATGKPLANYFMHNEHLLVDGHKMSKSLGNFYTLNDVMKMIKNPLALRYLFLQAHYRSKLDFTEESIKAAENTLENIYDLIRKLKFIEKNKFEGKQEEHNISDYVGPDTDVYFKGIKKALDNDLDTPKALFILHKVIINETNRHMEKLDINHELAIEILKFLEKIDKIFGLGFVEVEIDNLSKEEEGLISERERARKNKDFETSDRLRDELLKKGYELEDTPEGVRWRKIK